jgi:type II secretory pathway component GspD/PulD (secretin)
MISELERLQEEFTSAEQSPDRPTIRSEWPNLPRVTYNAESQPFQSVAADIASMLGVSSVLSASSESPVTVEFIDVEGRRALEAIAEQVGLSVRWDSGVVRWSADGGAAQAVIVSRVGFEDVEEVSQAARDFLGDKAVVQPIGDRLMVGGTDSQVSAWGEVSPFFDARPDAWLLRVSVVELAESVSRDLGLDYEIGGKVLADVAGAAGFAFDGVSSISAALAASAILRAASASTDGRVLTVGRLHLVEGGEASLRSGDTVPVPQRTVSPEGTVTTNGFTNVDTGFILNAKSRRVPTGLILDVRAELSSINGFVEEAPIVTSRTVEGRMILRSGETALLTGLDVLASSSETDTTLPLGAVKRTQRGSRVYVIIRADRIEVGGGP